MISAGQHLTHRRPLQHLAKHHPEKIVSLPSELPKALFDTKRTRVRTTHESSHRRSDPAWATLEDDFLRLGSFEGGAKPTSLLKEESNVVSFEGASPVPSSR